MCIDVSSIAATPDTRRSVAPPVRVPSTALHNSRPAARKLACSGSSATGCMSTRSRSAGRCQSHTTTSSTSDMASGVTIVGQRSAGSNRLPAIP
ncbi:hypothetical protein [Sphingomonas aerolata]|uniref:hypothetical protein n=1 Tax=Sphingomonas aerolata TaxID=185951 RepID=UPI002FE042E2